MKFEITKSIFKSENGKEIIHYRITNFSTKLTMYLPLENCAQIAKYMHRRSTIKCCEKFNVYLDGESKMRYFEPFLAEVCLKHQIDRAMLKFGYGPYKDCNGDDLFRVRVSVCGWYPIFRRQPNTKSLCMTSKTMSIFQVGEKFHVHIDIDEIEFSPEENDDIKINPVSSGKLNE